MLRSERRKILMRNLSIAKSKLKEMKEKQFSSLSKKIDKDFAYCLGALKGDGNVRLPKTGGGFVRLSVRDKDFAEYFKKNLDRWSGLKSRLFSYDGFWKVDLHSVSVARVFSTFNYSKLIGAEEQIKCAFIKGFSDAEGTIDRVSRRIRIYNSNKNIVDIVRRLLLDIGIESSVFRRNSEVHKFPGGRYYRVKAVYAVHISHNTNIEIFNKKIGFGIKRKQKILNDCLESLIAFQEKWRLKDIEMLKANFNENLSILAISKKLSLEMNRGPEAVRHAIYRYVINQKK